MGLVGRVVTNVNERPRRKPKKNPSLGSSFGPEWSSGGEGDDPPDPTLRGPLKDVEGDGVDEHGL